MPGPQLRSPYPKSTNKRKGKRSRSRLFRLSGRTEMYWGFSEPGAPHRNWPSQRGGWVGWRTSPRVILGQDWRAWSWVFDKCLHNRKSTCRKHQFMMFMAQVAEIICLNCQVEPWGEGPSNPITFFLQYWVYSNFGGQGWSIAVPYSMHWDGRDWYHGTRSPKSIQNMAKNVCCIFAPYKITAWSVWWLQRFKTLVAPHMPPSNF